MNNFDQSVYNGELANQILMVALLWSFLVTSETIGITLEQCCGEDISLEGDAGTRMAAATIIEEEEIFVIGGR